MIYVSGLSTSLDSRRVWFFLWSDTSDAELDTFAASISLTAEAYVTGSSLIPRLYHHRLDMAQRQAALAAGACQMSMSTYIERVRRGVHHDR